jgi:hypothetical protein
MVRSVMRLAQLAFFVAALGCSAQGQGPIGGDASHDAVLPHGDGTLHDESPKEDAPPDESSGSVDGNGAECTDSAPPVVAAANYDQTCLSADDCVLVTAGHASCVTNGGTCNDICAICTMFPTDAINRSEKKRFDINVAAAVKVGCNACNGCNAHGECPVGSLGCDIGECATPRCLHGKCAVQIGSRSLPDGACGGP